MRSPTFNRTRFEANGLPRQTAAARFDFALTRSLAVHHRNVVVQGFYLGPNFGNNPMGARLAEGAYLAVQIPETLQTVWDWRERAYNPANGQVVNRNDLQQLIPYNYLVFGVSRYEE